MKRVLWMVLVASISVPAFCAETPAPMPPASPTGARWVTKDSPAGFLLLDTQTGNVWVMKTDPAHPSAAPHFVPVSVDGQSTAQPVQSSSQSAASTSSKDDSTDLRVQFSHGSNPKEYDPNSPNP